MEWKHFDKYTPLTEDKESYVEELTAYCGDSPRRPQFHITPPCGLLNDPNGLAYYQGKYHVFYQWHPFGPNHGMKHWGHVTSKDMKQWTQSSHILTPTGEYEKNGCYSGNACQVGEQLYLYYTANYKTPEGKVPKQALAIMNPDGTIKKCDKNPIIDEQPKGLIGEIRDPFVFKREDRYYMFLGGGTKAGCQEETGHGRLLLYQSDDGIQWDYQGCVSLDGLEFGWMFECPAMVRVDGKDVLFLSPMGVEAEGDRYHNQFSTLYFVGELHLETMNFHVETYGELDKGFDFYAPQSFYDKEENPLFYGWIGCGEQQLPFMEEDMWIHGLTMPRRMRLKNGKLIQSVCESVAVQYSRIEMTENPVIPEGKTFLLALNQEEMEFSKVQIGTDEDCFIIQIDKTQRKITLDRSGLKHRFSEEYGMTRSLLVEKDSDITLELYYDNTFAELFINHGEETMTFRAFPEKLQISVS